MKMSRKNRKSSLYRQEVSELLIKAGAFGIVQFCNDPEIKIIRRQAVKDKPINNNQSCLSPYKEGDSSQSLKKVQKIA